MPIQKYEVSLSAEERKQLTKIVKSGNMPARTILRANILLAVDRNGKQPMTVQEAAIAFNTSATTVQNVRTRYGEKGLDATIQRQKRLEAGLKTVMKYDDAVIRLLKVYNETGNWNKAIKIMDSRHFHLWEGGGEIHDIYVMSHILKGKSLLDKKAYKRAMEEFRLATLYPENLEVPAPAKSVTIEDVISEMRQELNDNYAKFGDEDSASKAKSLDELEKLVKEIKMK